MQSNLFSEGLNLMTLGMGFVFIFLVFLVFAVNAMSKLIARWFPEPEAKPATKTVTPPPSVQQDNQLVAVLAAAVHHKRIQQNSL
ncbi:OadG family transporter subunit [uncultured Vibrio sp.]|uniref:OadG family protein n=1 Tax=uncultured Vibrio sp. TaxID=114054 RepID=UPI0029C88484|nr:OadG family transporter subunit [uncultured Vibrio sp.]